MNSPFEKYLPILSRIFIICFIVLGTYFMSTTFIFYILPFIISWILSSVLEPVILFFTKYLKLSRNTATFIAVLFSILFMGTLIALIGGMIIIQLTKLSMELPQYSRNLYFHSNHLTKKLEHLYIQLPPDIAQSIINGINGLFQNLTTIIGKCISSLLSFISAIPGFFIFLLVTIMATFFIARDKPKIKKFIIAQLPKNTISKSRIIKQNLLFALTGYIKAQFILMFITFVESTIGLTIIGIDYAVLIAFFASIIDALPILGTGFIYVPLILLKFLTHSYDQCLHLSILYGIIILVRQLLEPKILGNQIGLYPLVTLISMYVGLKLFGILGLLIGPISVVIFTTFQKIDLLPKWKN
ncbi:sporulation integral membrane protein YtvI [Marinisporobacter balticus]|uniref:Sporulation integral membrane protein YtvI n=1 Tax=Marinisporobacter balticus TaxID=2018667 RepID=A0A4R2KIH8_9FIRM|nr:sporulation integral membrane protein YtvI [Marinisporobacter balticus]TCO72292.1 sporulation integral membrane protein YtvI [Marinisporobacter balticus]